VSAHRTRHSLKRCRTTVFPRFKARNVKVMSTCRFCRRFPCEVAIAHSTLRRHFRCRWKQVGAFCMSPTHRILFVLGALALRPTLDHFWAPFVHPWESPWGPWVRIRYVNPARRTPNRALVFTRCTGTRHRGALYSYGWRWTGWTRWTRICSVWYESMNTKKRYYCRREI